MSPAGGGAEARHTGRSGIHRGLAGQVMARRPTARSRASKAAPRHRRVARVVGNVPVPLLRTWHGFGENGKFVWIMDPEENKIELREPKVWDDGNKGA
jgi:hypothetical protein